ncbi:MAG TPA: penicillin-binding transpeptidase domain-containing protein [Polyangiaceae bacterium]|nr:penicillin-binding transpeptidase domain-containing protein [Polyangiaceae bacterium]
MHRTRLLALAGASLLGGGVLVAVHLRGRCHAEGPAIPSGSAVPSIARVSVATQHEDEPPPQGSPPVPGLDLTRVSVAGEGLVAPADGGVAHLTLDPDLQHTAIGLMAARHLPEAAAVVMDVQTGRLLVYASRAEQGPARDLCAEASAPSASVFKIVTAAALVEDAHLDADTRQCYSGGEQRITATDLIDDPHRDRWCATLASALGRSINTVFARLAKEHLVPAQLDAMARRFGYGDALAFDAPVQAGAIHVPAETLEFARTAAGFWNSTLSPVQAAEMSAIVARGGEAVRPVIVDEVVSTGGWALRSAPATPSVRRVLTKETADELAAMMEHTVMEGTSWRAFHDGQGIAFLPGVAVAGKTGTLTDPETQRYYTWFTGFAPARPAPGAPPQVAVGVLVVNGPSWQIKANVLARDILRTYFAKHDLQGVSRPSLTAVARRRKK